MVFVMLGSSYHTDVCSSANFFIKFGFHYLFDAVKTSVCIDWNLATAAPSPDHYGTDSGSKCKRWWRSYPGSFGFSSGYWVQVETCRSSLYTVYGQALSSMRLRLTPCELSLAYLSLFLINGNEIYLLLFSMLHLVCLLVNRMCYNNNLPFTKVCCCYTLAFKTDGTDGLRKWNIAWTEPG